MYVHVVLNVNSKLYFAVSYFGDFVDTANSAK